MADSGPQGKSISYQILLLGLLDLSMSGTNISNIVLRFMQEEESEVSITMNEVVDDDDVVAREEKEEEEEDENVVIVAVCLF
ncbi:unnamed protein product [Lactuca virosa]|uniref:Uncharacterized protein n=1 Tax=Lactuca virosa TaxID=75947 RepID=A0AAU9PXU8_9ASTR|nr:unnamed protein product [Lactuca virosa]